MPAGCLGGADEVVQLVAPSLAGHHKSHSSRSVYSSCHLKRDSTFGRVAAVSYATRGRRAMLQCCTSGCSVLGESRGSSQRRANVEPFLVMWNNYLVRAFECKLLGTRSMVNFDLTRTMLGSSYMGNRHVVKE